MSDALTSFLEATVRTATPLAFAALGVVSLIPVALKKWKAVS